MRCGRPGCRNSSSLGDGWTCSGCPICAAAGVANLELTDKLDLVPNAGETGLYFRTKLAKALAAHANVGDVRGNGLLAAVVFVADKADRVFFEPGKKISHSVRCSICKVSCEAVSRLTLAGV